MKIIALDIGSNMALAHNLRGNPCVIFREFKGDRAYRAAGTQTWLEDRLKMLVAADVIVYERPFNRGYDATRSSWGLAGIIEACATRAGMAVLDVENGTVKRFALGKRDIRGTTKQDMIAAAQLMGYTGDNEHEADAWCLLQYAMDRVQWDDTKKKSRN